MEANKHTAKPQATLVFAIVLGNVEIQYRANRKYFFKDKTNDCKDIYFVYLYSTFDLQDMR